MHIHGGIIAMAVDSASGVAINDLIGNHRGAVTVELKVIILIRPRLGHLCLCPSSKKGKKNYNLYSRSV